MQRKDIDEGQFADLRLAMEDAVITTGAITMIAGQHPLYGALILVAASDAYAVLGNDVHLVVGRDDSLERDMAAENDTTALAA